MWVFKWDNFRHMHMKVDSKYIQVSLCTHFLFHWIYYKLNKNYDFFGIINVKKNYFWNELVNMVFKMILSLEKKLNKHIVLN